MVYRRTRADTRDTSPEAVARPQVLLPYPGPESNPDIQDIFVYMRPETNGVVGESAIMRVIERCPAYKIDIHLVYLANVPGEYLLHHHVIEDHYSCKLYFAVHGKKAFTPRMRAGFSDYFGVPFEEAPIIGSFEALRRLKLRPAELFEQWVGEADFLSLNGQTVKRVQDYFVVNYDIPALLHKNNRETDVAVMLFRTSLDYAYFDRLLGEMRDALVGARIMNPMYHMSRAVHYSKSPFEQILDGLGYLYHADGRPAGLEDLSFACYLEENGFTEDEILGAIYRPVAQFDEEGDLIEENLINYTYHDSYADALRKWCRMICQHRLAE